MSAVAHTGREGHPTRERILRAGVRLFQEKGYHGTGIAEILELSRSPKGSFYHHFPGGKEELAVETVRWLAHDVDVFLDQGRREGLGGTDLALDMAGYAASGLAHARQMRGSLISVLAQETVPGSPAIAAALGRAIDGWRSRLAAAFEAEGAFDPGGRAEVALAAVEGGTTLARIAGRPALVREVVAAALASGR